jgi:hypothetical protein
VYSARNACFDAELKGALCKRCCKKTKTATRKDGCITHCYSLCRSKKSSKGVPSTLRLVHPPALNKFKPCACATPTLHVCPTKILPGNFLFTEIAYGRIVLVTYPSLPRRVFYRQSCLRRQVTCMGSILLLGATHRISIELARLFGSPGRRLSFGESLRWVEGLGLFVWSRSAARHESCMGEADGRGKKCSMRDVSQERCMLHGQHALQEHRIPTSILLDKAAGVRYQMSARA